MMTSSSQPQAFVPLAPTPVSASPQRGRRAPLCPRTGAPPRSRATVVPRAAISSPPPKPHHSSSSPSDKKNGVPSSQQQQQQQQQRYHAAPQPSLLERMRQQRQAERERRARQVAAATTSTTSTTTTATATTVTALTPTPTPTSTPTPARAASAKPSASASPLAIEEPPHVASADALAALLATGTAAGRRVAVLKVYSRKCRSCMAARRPFARTAAAHAADATFVQLCAEDNVDFAKALGLRAFPTFIVYRDGKRVDHFSGISMRPVVQALEDYA